MNDYDEALLIDYLNQELSPEERTRVTALLAEDQLLSARYRALQRLRKGVEAHDPRPSAAADMRFDAFMATLTDAPRAKVRRMPSFHWAAAAAVLLLTFSLGWYYGTAGDRELNRQLAASRSLMLELMEDEKMSTRLRATTVAAEIPVADPELIGNLGYLLRNDENTNVRLAALEALANFADDELTRRQLLEAMEEELPDIVRFQLIELLVVLEEQRVLPYLEEMMNTDTLPRHLRDVAQLGSFKLI